MVYTPYTVNTFITTLTEHCYWNLYPARRIHSQCHTSFADNGSLGFSPWKILRSAQSKGSKTRTAATNTLNNQLLVEDKRCHIKLRVKGGEYKLLLITNVQMAHGTCTSRRGCGTDSAASFGKSTLSVVQVVKACALKWGRRQSRGLVRRNHAKKVAHWRCLQNGCPV